MALTVEAKEHYRLKQPKWAETYGQGNPPESLVIVRDGSRLAIPFGATVRASGQVERPGSDASAPIIVHTEDLQQLANNDQLEHIEA